VSEEQTILHGAWDLHVHASPSLFERRADAFQLAHQARDAGMAGVVWKSHHGSTVEAAALVDSQTQGVNVFGGIVLNAFVGGLNPDAVDAAVALGARVVWLPTIHAAHHAEALGTPGGFDFQDSPLRRSFEGGIRIVDAAGKLRSEVHEIIELLAGRNVVLATGHISAPEIAVLCNAVRSGGRRVRILVNHALFHAPSLDETDIADLADDFVYFEACHLSTTWLTSATTIDRVASVIGSTSDAQWILATDSGQAANVATPDALRSFASSLVDRGIEAERVRAMICTTPARLLGL
jgi:hypothetical protein